MKMLPFNSLPDLVRKDRKKALYCVIGKEELREGAKKIRRERKKEHRREILKGVWK